MSMPELTVSQLVRCGFERVGCWELNREQKLMLNVDLPSRAGVYAFAIDGVVQYVGLASKSIRQRLGFYGKPGSSQTTNIRLNELICGRIEQGAVVEILIAHPPDYDWKGLKISGAEGLESGLIRTFNLPWNVRGVERSTEFVKTSEGKKESVGERILNVVRRRPGLTELEIAKAIFGQSAIQQDVNQDCRLLVQLRAIERCGVGGRGDPYTYSVVEK